MFASKALSRFVSVSENNLQISDPNAIAILIRNDKIFLPSTNLSMAEQVEVDAPIIAIKSEIFDDGEQEANCNAPVESTENSLEKKDILLINNIGEHDLIGQPKVDFNYKNNILQNNNTKDIRIEKIESIIPEILETEKIESVIPEVMTTETEKIGSMSIEVTNTKTENIERLISEVTKTGTEKVGNIIPEVMKIETEKIFENANSVDQSLSWENENEVESPSKNSQEEKELTLVPQLTNSEYPIIMSPKIINFSEQFCQADFQPIVTEVSSLAPNASDVPQSLSLIQGETIQHSYEMLEMAENILKDDLEEKKAKAQLSEAIKMEPHPIEGPESDDYEPPMKRSNNTISPVSSTVTSSTQLAKISEDNIYVWEWPEKPTTPKESNADHITTPVITSSPMKSPVPPSKNSSEKKKHKSQENKVKLTKSSTRLRERNARNQEKKIVIEPKNICQVSIQGESDQESNETSFLKVKEYHGNADYEMDETEKLESMNHFNGNSSGEWSEEESNSESHASSHRVWSTKLQHVSIQPFQGLLPGPAGIAPADATELQFFLLFFPEKLIKIMRQQTNLFAEHSQNIKQCSDQKWAEVSFHEMKSFLAIHILMAMSPRHDPFDYWSDDEVLCSPYISKVMSWNRFCKIEQYFYVSDVKKCDEKELKDPLFKVRPVVDCILEKASLYYNLHREIVFKELQIGNENLHSHQNNLSHRPSALCDGKVYILMDGVTGYIKNLTFSAENVTKGVGKSRTVHYSLHQTVFNLLQPYVNLNHHFYCDKNVTSVKLFENLQANGIFACGSCRSNKKGFPKSLRFGNNSKNPIKNFNEGEYLARQNGNMVALIWRYHSFTVNLLSTMFNASQTDVFDPCNCSSSINGNLNCPPPVLNYQKFLLNGACTSNFRYFNNCSKFSHNCWKHYIWFCLEVALNNAFILWKELKDSSANCKTFQINIGKALIKESKWVEEEKAVVLEIKKDSLPATDHKCICYRGRPRDCFECKQVSIKFGHVCRKTQYGCSQCGARLCPGACFQKYHQSLLNKVSASENNISPQVEITHGDHKCIRYRGRPNTCYECKKIGNLISKTQYGCRLCNVRLCKSNCFFQYHEKLGTNAKIIDNDKSSSEIEIISCEETTKEEFEHPASEHLLTEEVNKQEQLIVIQDSDSGGNNKLPNNKLTHVCVYFRRYQICHYCSMKKVTNESGKIKESRYGCSQCNVHLCQGICFEKFHETIITSEAEKNQSFGDHNCVRFKGKSRLCRQCQQEGRLTEDGHQKKTYYGCDVCDVSLCRGECFLRFHHNNLENTSSGKVTNSITGHDCIEIDGQPRECSYCKITGRLTNKGKSVETRFGCATCNVTLCRGYCFNCFHKIKNIAISSQTLLLDTKVIGGHTVVKFEGVPQPCHYCEKSGRKTSSGKIMETSYGCEACCVSLCQGDCFYRFHLDTTVNPLISSSTDGIETIANKKIENDIEIEIELSS